MREGLNAGVSRSAEESVSKAAQGPRDVTVNVCA